MSARAARFSRWPLGFFALLGLATSAGAQPRLPISVERSTGAEACPDDAQLTARIAALRGDGHSTEREAIAYRVGFSKTPRGFGATIRSTTPGAAPRTLEATDPSCAGLAHATAVTLAMLLDVELSVDVLEPTAPVAPPPPPPPSPPREAPKPVTIVPVLSLGAGALVGVLRPLTGAVLSDVGIETRHFRASAGVVWALPQRQALGPGTARTSLVSAQLRLCYGFFPRRNLRFDACSGALIGVANAEARGFTLDGRQREPFLAFPAELSASTRNRSAGLELGVAGLLLTPPNEFVVRGVGAVYRPSSVALMLTLRAQLRFMR